MTFIPAIIFLCLLICISERFQSRQENYANQLLRLRIAQHCPLLLNTTDAAGAVKHFLKQKQFVGLLAAAVGLLAFYDLYPLLHWERKHRQIQKALGRPWLEVEPEFPASGLKGNIHQDNIVHVEIYPYRFSRISRAIFAVAIWYDRSNQWVELRIWIFPSAMLRLDSSGNVTHVMYR